MQYWKRLLCPSQPAPAFGSAQAPETKSRRPNVLVIQPDQHRGTIMGCMGDTQAKTPNLDRLSREGILYSPEPFKVLYNQRNDSHEWNNLYTAPESQGQRKRLHELLVMVAEEVQDPMAAELRWMGN